MGQTHIHIQVCVCDTQWTSHRHGRGPGRRTGNGYKSISDFPSQDSSTGAMYRAKYDFSNDFNSFTHSAKLRCVEKKTPAAAQAQRSGQSTSSTVS